MSRTDPVISETTPGPQLRTEKARQGQNIRGMLTVLIASVVLLWIGYSVMVLVASQTAGEGTRPGEVTIPPAVSASPSPPQ